MFRVKREAFNGVCNVFCHNIYNMQKRACMVMHVGLTDFSLVNEHWENLTYHIIVHCASKHETMLSECLALSQHSDHVVLSAGDIHCTWGNTGNLSLSRNFCWTKCLAVVWSLVPAQVGPRGGQFSTIWDGNLNPASRSMYTSRRRLLYYVEPGCEADYKICISVKLIVTLWKTPIYTIFLIYRFLAIWLYKMYHAWLNRPWELSWLLTFSSLNLPLSSSSTTSSKLLSQFRLVVNEDDLQWVKN